jgi:nucleoside-diphosphate-sugar epimerase
VDILADNQRMRPAASEVERLWGCNAKAFALSGWKPKISFEEGLEKTIAWFVQPQNLAQYKAGIYNV